MNEREICKAVDALVANCVIKQDKFLSSQREKLDQFYSRPYGNEEEGRSTVVTTEISDLVTSDMASLARVFLGASDVVEFIPSTDNPEDVQEARDKQAYISYVIETADNSYREQYSVLKSALIYDVAAIEYGKESKKVTEVKKFEGVDIDEITALVTSFEEEDGIESVEVTDGDTVEFKLTRVVDTPFIRNVPIERLLISSNASRKDEAQCIGKEWQKRRGELVADGFSRKQVVELTNSDNTTSVITDSRFFDQGGTIDKKIVDEWSNEMVSGVDVYVLLDTDDNGIFERHHIIKSSSVILSDDIVDHVPYAIGSAELMPDNLIGRGRVSLVQSHQKVNTFLTRGIINNIARVNNPRTVIRKDPNGVSGVSMSDLLDDRDDGVIRTDGMPTQDILSLTVPYIGDAVMQVQAVFDQKLAQTTGNQMANQSLQADHLHKETATRFEGMQNLGLAKIELVARNLAETIWTELYEGLAWVVSRFQDSEREFNVLGRQLTVNPAKWQFDHKIRAVVGTGAGDDSKTLQNLAGILAMQREAVAAGSTLADESKVYNTIVKMVRAMGQHTPSEFFNDPAEPAEVMKAELGILRNQVTELAQQLQQKNPLAEVEQIKNQDREAQRQFDAAMSIKNDELEKMKMQINALQKQAEESVKLTELELKYGQDVPGSAV